MYRDTIGDGSRVFTSYGAPIKDYKIYGNTIQNCTPSPDMPVDVVGCGVRTENLLNQDADGWGRNYCIRDNGFVNRDEYFDISPYIEILPKKVYTLVNKNYGSNVYNAFYDDDKHFISSFKAFGQTLYTATSPSNAKYIRCSVLAMNRYPDAARKAMLIEGDTEPPAFIPYGYKLPETITNGIDTITTPIYIGSEPFHRIAGYADYVDYAIGKIVRKIKKLVLTGEETSWGTISSIYYVVETTNALPWYWCVCTHCAPGDTFNGNVNT
jgi:hypothetical protein